MLLSTLYITVYFKAVSTISNSAGLWGIKKLNRLLRLHLSSSRSTPPLLLCSLREALFLRQVFNTHTLQIMLIFLNLTLLTSFRDFPDLRPSVPAQPLISKFEISFYLHSWSALSLVLSAIITVEEEEEEELCHIHIRVEKIKVKGLVQGPTMIFLL